MFDPNLEAIYEVMYSRCPVCCADPNPQLTDALLRIVRQNPPQPNEMTRWVANPKDVDCEYCKRMLDIYHGC